MPLCTSALTRKQPSPRAGEHGRRTELARKHERHDVGLCPAPHLFHEVGADGFQASAGIERRFEVVDQGHAPAQCTHRPGQEGSGRKERKGEGREHSAGPGAAEP